MRNIFRSIIFCSAFFFQLSAYADSGQFNFAIVEKMFIEGRYEEVVNNASGIIAARSYRRDEMYYLKGLSELKLGRFSDARQSFDAIVNGPYYSRHKFDAYVGIGDSYFLENNLGSAVNAFESVLTAFPDDQNRATVYYRLSECYAKMGNADKTQYYFDSARMVAPLAFEATGMPTVEIPKNASVKIIQAVSAPDKRTDKRSPDARISIQVGSFKSKGNADRFASKLDGEGFDSHTEEAQSNGDALYRVRVGKFSTKEEAANTAMRLKKRGYSIKICDNDLCQ